MVCTCVCTHTYEFSSGKYLWPKGGHTVWLCSSVLPSLTRYILTFQYTGHPSSTLIGVVAKNPAPAFLSYIPLWLSCWVPDHPLMHCPLRSQQGLIGGRQEQSTLVVSSWTFILESTFVCFPLVINRFAGLCHFSQHRSFCCPLVFMISASILSTPSPNCTPWWFESQFMLCWELPCSLSKGQSPTSNSCNT